MTTILRDYNVPTQFVIFSCLLFLNVSPFPIIPKTKIFLWEIMHCSLVVRHVVGCLWLCLCVLLYISDESDDGLGEGSSLAPSNPLLAVKNDHINPENDCKDSCRDSEAECGTLNGAVLQGIRLKIKPKLYNVRMSFSVYIALTSCCGLLLASNAMNVVHSCLIDMIIFGCSCDFNMVAFIRHSNVYMILNTFTLHLCRGRSY